MNHTSTLRHAAASVAALAITLSFAHSSLLHAADGAPQPPTAAIAAACAFKCVIIIHIWHNVSP